MAIEMDKIIVSKILQHFSPRRVVGVIAYGSALDKQCKNEDYDFFLVLKSFNEKDFLILEKILKYFKDTNVSLFINYKDWVEKKGIHNYQFGRHGVYFINVLTEGNVLYGKNIYSEYAKKIKSREIKHDLLYRIEEYFYRIQKELKISNSDATNHIKKYFYRIMIDLMLLEKIVSFKEVARTHYKRLVDEKMSINDLLLCKKFKKDYLRFDSYTDNTYVPKLYKKLYTAFIQCYQP
jgi:hypothetical protein